MHIHIKNNSTPNNKKEDPHISRKKQNKRMKIVNGNRIKPREKTNTSTELQYGIKQAQTYNHPFTFPNNETIYTQF